MTTSGICPKHGALRPCPQCLVLGGDDPTSTIEEAWAVVADIQQGGGIKGHESPHRTSCEHCEELRQLALAVLEEAAASVDEHDTIGGRAICVDPTLRARIESLGKDA